MEEKEEGGKGGGGTEEDAMVVIVIVMVMLMVVVMLMLILSWFALAVSWMGPWIGRVVVRTYGPTDGPTASNSVPGEQVVPTTATGRRFERALPCECQVVSSAAARVGRLGQPSSLVVPVGLGWVGLGWIGFEWIALLDCFIACFCASLLFLFLVRSFIDLFVY